MEHIVKDHINDIDGDQANKLISMGSSELTQSQVSY